jgi:hypothetical protein
VVKIRGGAPTSEKENYRDAWTGAVLGLQNIRGSKMNASFFIGSESQKEI